MQSAPPSSRFFFITLDESPVWWFKCGAQATPDTFDTDTLMRVSFTTISLRQRFEKGKHFTSQLPRFLGWPFMALLIKTDERAASAHFSLQYSRHTFPRPRSARTFLLVLRLLVTRVHCSSVIVSMTYTSTKWALCNSPTTRFVHKNAIAGKM